MRCTLLVAAFILLAPLEGSAQTEAGKTPPPAPPAGSQTSPSDNQTGNVNSRYVIDGVHYPGNLKGELQHDVERLVGANYDEAAVENLARRIRKELHVQTVAHRIEKGDSPNHVKVFFETKGHRFEQDANITKLVYHSKSGFTGGLETEFDVRQLRLGAGVQSDSDSLVERYAGWNAYVARIIADRIQVRFDFDDFHQIWNGSTRVEEDSDPDVAGVYRTRRAYRPTVKVLVARGLTYTAGADLQQMQFQFPAVRTEAANSVLQSLRLRRNWESSGSLRGEVDAGYNLRAATRVLDSDFVYVRHAADVETTIGTETQGVTVRAGGGMMNGRAPLFERFVAGNSRILRGWNKFDLDPLGGSRLAYGSVEYRYHHLLVFYDTGTIWDRDEATVLRHGAGGGLAWSGWYIAVAFPIRSNGVQPVFMLATNF